jgi:hypothetical protein
MASITAADCVPVLDVLEPVDQHIKVDSFGRVKVELIPECGCRLFGGQWFIERVLLDGHPVRVVYVTILNCK